jgi:beta-alanine--pyruvate transaminase
MATLDIYAREHLFERAAAIAPVFADAFHSLRNSPHVIDIRNLGLVAGIELEPRPGEPGKRAFEVFLDCFENGVLTRQTGDILAFSPPLIVEENQIHRMVESVAKALQRVS